VCKSNVEVGCTLRRRDGKKETALEARLLDDRSAGRRFLSNHHDGVLLRGSGPMNGYVSPSKVRRTRRGQASGLLRQSSQAEIKAFPQ
jgi:hypothetical protein